MVFRYFLRFCLLEGSTHFLQDISWALHSSAEGVLVMLRVLMLEYAALCFLGERPMERVLLPHRPDTRIPPRVRSGRRA